MKIVAEYTWTEKKDQIKVSVPLKGVSPKKVDILVSTYTLKVNFSPYILDVVLFDEVDSIQHKATVKDGTLHITLCKRQPGFWGQFESDESDLDVIRAKKSASLKAREELNNILTEKQKDKKIEEERHAVRQQMALEDAERTRLEQTKQQEKEAAEKEVYEVLSKLQQNDKNNHFAEAKSETSTKKAVLFRQLPEPTSQQYNDDDEYDMLDDFDEKPKDIQNEAASSNIFFVSDETNNDPDEIGGEEMIEENIKYIPPPRNTIGNNISLLSDDKATDNNNKNNNKVPINFTPRVFPTPMRESKAAEEEDWIAKNRRHLKRHGILSKHLQSSTSSLKKQGSGGGDVSEEDASWLKAKGDDFFRIGDIRSALNAYSAALDADEEFVACYSNRASCYLTLQLYEACVEDCVAAIERIQKELKQAQERDTAIGPCRDTDINSNNSSGDIPSVVSHEAQSQRQREDTLEQQRLWSLYVKLLVRRGGAYCHMGQFQQSLADYVQAQVTVTQHATQLAQHLQHITLQSLADDVARLKQLVAIENNKKEADVLYAEGRVLQALDAYDTVLKQFPVYVAALANRAACHMLQQDYAKCVADCDTALSLLNDCSSDSFSKMQRSSMVTVFLPAKGSDKRKQWLLRLYTRKAVALISLEHFALAWEAYEAACKIDPENAALKQDRDALETLIEQRMAQQSQVQQEDNNNNSILALEHTE